jgi:hypothetical protein
VRCGGVLPLPSVCGGDLDAATPANTTGKRERGGRTQSSAATPLAVTTAELREAQHCSPHESEVAPRTTNARWTVVAEKTLPARRRGRACEGAGTQGERGGDVREKEEERSTCGGRADVVRRPRVRRGQRAGKGGGKGQKEGADVIV